MTDYRIALALSLLLAPLSATAVDYLTDVKPILSRACYSCHGSTQQKGDLRLDTAVFAQKGGERGPSFKPGNSAESLLIRLVKGDHTELPQMPYKKAPLSPAEIATLAAWVDGGARSPVDEQIEAGHWAFRPPTRPQLPITSDASWSRNPIDKFILARLERENIAPSSQADSTTLHRRLFLDLVGLPPSPEDQGTLPYESSPHHYETLVDRLLQSPHFGERWGRHWLDVARYADSNGYSIDAPRSIWRYRDWVIHALNQNLPFDQFTIEQLAGDLLPNATTEQLVATGFHRNTQINQEGGIDREQFRIESVVDRVATTGTAWLGLTIACAQCHDHKFDPFSQQEYYQLFAFFNNQDEPSLELPTPVENARRQHHQSQLDKLQAKIDGQRAVISDKVLNWEKFLSETDIKDLEPNLQEVLFKPREIRTAEEQKVLLDIFTREDETLKQLDRDLNRLKRQRPRVTTSMILRERSKARQTHIHIKGDFTRKGRPVSSGVPAILNPLGDSKHRTRLDLARWLTDRKNPLTARVIVNRIWQQYFGRGIVETENDFGTQGIPPSHPELLDWLAVELMESGWDLKHLHRLIVTSATYRQSSNARPDLEGLDPNNKLLARQNRLRLDSEIVRDVSLALAGLLSGPIGGPSVYPPQPDGVMNLGQSNRKWTASDRGDRFRRGMYTFYWRATPHPALAVFDSPDAFSSCTRRIRSNTPLQALTLLNDVAFFEIAQALATRILSDGPKSDEGKIRFGFQLCCSRNANQDEVDRLIELLNDSKSSETAAWLDVARALLNLDEVITRE